jgi:hypothetical protein
MQPDLEGQSIPNVSLGAALVPLAAVVLALAVQSSGGTYSPVAIKGLGLAMLLMLAGITAKPRISLVWLDYSLVVLATAQLAVLVVWTPPIHGWTTGGIVVAALSLGLIAMQSGGPRWPIYPLCLGVLVAGVGLLHTFPNPGIDVLMFQGGGAAALLQGENPYAVRFRDPYPPEVSAQFYGLGVSVNGVLQTGYPYPPLSLLMVVPARLLGDVRYASLACIVASGLLVGWASRGRTGRLAAAMLMLSPITPYVLWLGWTESHVLFCMALVFACWRRLPRLLPYAFGLLLVSKQYMPAVAPLALLLLPRPWTLTQIALFGAKAAMVAAALTLPFLLWNPSEFWNSVVAFQMRQPFRLDALSFLVAAKPTDPSAWICLPFVGLLVALALPLAAPRRMSFYLTSAVALCVFFSLSKQAFANYYFLVVGTLYLAVAAEEQTDDEGTDGG